MSDEEMEEERFALFKVASHPKCDHFGKKNILRWQDRS